MPAEYKESVQLLLFPVLFGYTRCSQCIQMLWFSSYFEVPPLWDRADFWRSVSLLINATFCSVFQKDLSKDLWLLISPSFTRALIWLSTIVIAPLTSTASVLVICSPTPCFPKVSCNCRQCSLLAKELILQVSLHRITWGVCVHVKSHWFQHR